MTRLNALSLALLFVIQPAIVLGQSVDRPKPGFALSIEVKDPSSDAFDALENHTVLVTYTNTSDAIQPDWRENSLKEHSLNIMVLRDGAPAEETKTMQALKRYREALRSGKTVTMDLHGVPKPLKPAESVTFPLHLGWYFDMSKPGTYTVTVNRETFPWEPAKSVTVWSNTITIVVPAAAEKAPEQ